jgi:hypothetical protein
MKQAEYLVRNNTKQYNHAETAGYQLTDQNWIFVTGLLYVTIRYTRGHKSANVQTFLLVCSTCSKPMSYANIDNFSSGPKPHPV